MSISRLLYRSKKKIRYTYHLDLVCCNNDPLHFYGVRILKGYKKVVFPVKIIFIINHIYHFLLRVHMKRGEVIYLFNENMELA